MDKEYSLEQARIIDGQVDIIKEKIEYVKQLIPEPERQKISIALSLIEAKTQLIREQIEEGDAKKMEFTEWLGKLAVKKLNLTSNFAEGFAEEVNKAICIMFDLLKKEKDWVNIEKQDWNRTIKVD